MIIFDLILLESIRSKDMEKLNEETLKLMILSGEESKINLALQMSRNFGFNLDNFYKALSELHNFYEHHKKRIYTFNSLYQEIKDHGILLSGLNLNELPESLTIFSEIIFNINISQNNFSEIPSVLYVFHKLNSLNISSNKIRNLPIKFFNLKEIKSLNISNNLILKLPKKIFELDTLRHLSVSSINPEFFPNGINNFQLQTFEIDCVNTFTVPSSIFEIKSLKVLKLEGIAELPNSIAEASNLEKLTISRSGIENLPDKISNLKFLKTLELSDLKLLVEFPKVIFELESLETLNLKNSPINELPSSIRRLKNLKTIIIDGCASLEKVKHWKKRIESWGKKSQGTYLHKNVI